MAQVSWHFGRADEQPLAKLSWGQADVYLRQGEFPPGSMGPKIESALAFLESGGRRAIVTSPELIAAALDCRAGTEILAPDPVLREPVPHA